VGEANTGGAGYLVRKHRDRALLLVSSRCHFYCRFCFRRSFPNGGHRDPTAQELEQALDAIESEPEITEVILSGGDPLVLEDARLEAILERIRRMPGARRVRVHTRTPVVLPERVTPQLAALLGRAPGCRVVTHCNHPRELTQALVRVARTLGTHGVPLLNQSVLLAGVNDDPELLARLQRGLAQRGCRPYYLHHTDRTPGNAHFRVSLDRGVRIYRRLRQLLPPEQLPRYVVDLPDGTGKVPVEKLSAAGSRRWRYTHPDGRVSALVEA
jgi:lysine 2,3-aminomutase